MTIAFDTETELFRPGVGAPPLVCVTFKGSQGAGLLHHTDARPALAAWFRSSERIVGQFIAYDNAVICQAFPDLIPLVFDAYDADRVTDTKLRAQMIDIAQGQYRGKLAADGEWIAHNYGLEDLARRYLKVQLQKDGWRMRYGAFRDVPLSGWVARAKEIQADSRARLAEFAATGRTEASLSKDGKKWIKELQAIVSDAPDQVLKYPVDDAIQTDAVYQVQETAPADFLVDQFRQARADFALHLSSTWGLRTSKEGVDRLRAATDAALSKCTAKLQASGLVREDGTRDTKKAIARMLEVCGWERMEGVVPPFPLPKGWQPVVSPGWKTCGGVRKDSTPEDRGHFYYAPDNDDTIPLRLTATKEVCLDADACEACDDELLGAYADFTGLGKTRNNDVAMLEKGITQPVHTRYGLAASGRTTSSNPPIQNLRKFPGIRECFVPRAGKVFIQGDYPQLELYTLAQCCYTWLGHSTLGDMLKRGIDPHTSFAAKLAGISYEEGLIRSKAKTPEGKHFKDYLRQIGKVFNFGKPGGLGPAKLVTLAATDAYGNVTITEEQAKEYGKLWLETLPEMKEYFARVNASIKNAKKLATVVLPGTGFVRGGAMYCAACNTGFQGLGAACAKNAMWQVAREQYARPSSVLYGTRTAWFVHDEIAAEADESTCHESAHELVRIMRVAANEFLPDVPYTAEKLADVPTVMRMWSKDATQVFVNGRLVPWEAAA